MYVGGIAPRRFEVFFGRRGKTALAMEYEKISKWRFARERVSIQSVG